MRFAPRPARRGPTRWTGELVLHRAGDAHEAATGVRLDDLDRFEDCRTGRLRGVGCAGNRARHQQPDRSGRATTRELADDAALVHDGDAVGQPEHLVELGRDQHDGRSLVALAHDAPVHELHRSDVETARRLRDDEQLQWARQFAGEHDLLLVAARQRAGRRTSSLRMRTSNSSTLATPFAAIAAMSRPNAAGESGALVHVEDEVLGDGEAAHQPVVRAILRHVADRRDRAGRVPTTS